MLMGRYGNVPDPETDAVLRVWYHLRIDAEQLGKLGGPGLNTRERLPPCAVESGSWVGPTPPPFDIGFGPRTGCARSAGICRLDS